MDLSDDAEIAHHAGTFHSMESHSLNQTKEKPKGGTLPAAICNLINVSIGAGLLSFPYVFQQTGIILGAILLALLSILMGFLSDMITKVCYKIYQQAPNVYITYERLVDLIVGKKLAIIVVICVITNIFAAQIALLIIAGDSISPILDHFNNTSMSWWTNRSFVTASFAIIAIFPMCFLTKLKHLRWTSFFGVLALCCASVMIVAFSLEYVLFDNGKGIVDEQDRGDIHLFTFSYKLFIAIPIMIYSLSFQIQIPTLFQELHNRSLDRFRIVFSITLGLCATLFGIVGMFGYLEFGESTKGNILDNFPNDSMWANIARLFMIVAALFSYPMLVNINRKSIDCLTEMILRKNYYDDSIYELPSRGLYFWVRVFILNAIMIFLAWGISVLEPQIQLIFGFAGSVTITSFVVPCILHWRAHRNQFYYGCVMSTLLGLFGCLIGTLGLASTSYEMVVFYMNVHFD